MIGRILSALSPYVKEVEEVDAKDISRKRGFSCFPISLLPNELPYFSQRIEEFVRLRARRDLPETQFHSETLKLEEIVEIGGFLSHSFQTGEIRELEYLYPKNSSIIINMHGIGFGHNLKNLTLKILGNEDLIFYHTHPLGVEFYSSSDILTHSDIGSKVAEVNEGKSYFYGVLYIPLSDSFKWYGSKKICLHER
ncbi:hypothetical protein COU59_03440 [Candidatus Pacearchaeota archaeon CG10_big_fil_rev_8_21_14_0_10_34_12]|nr:MAG: hypothetical protein COU59_03440 [Candidatus Pacearchaeota archaeon CG10_big_fil_rev_8_21_14_0_10_34_12]